MKNKYPKEFLKYFRQHIKRSQNYKEKTSQKLSASFQEEMYYVYSSSKDFYEFTELQKLFNFRGQLAKFAGFNIHMNFNSKIFMRDTNYSISFISNNQERGLIGFEPTKDGAILVKQMQGAKGINPKIHLPIHWRNHLVNMVEELFDEYYSEIRIIRAEEIPYFNKPIKLDPKRSMEDHQKTLRNIYNRIPTEKWGFTYNANERFSKKIINGDKLVYFC